MYKVYIQVTNDNKIYNINSSPFIADLTNWIYVDEGVGEKYLYAQQAYLQYHLRDDNGILRYRYINNEIVERTEEERLEEYRVRFQESIPEASNVENRMAALEESLANYEAAYNQGVNEA
jgi:hypothetical protein